MWVVLAIFPIVCTLARQSSTSIPLASCLTHHEGKEFHSSQPGTWLHMGRSGQSRSSHRVWSELCLGRACPQIQSGVLHHQKQGWSVSWVRWVPGPGRSTSLLKATEKTLSLWEDEAHLLLTVIMSDETIFIYMILLKFRFISPSFLEARLSHLTSRSRSTVLLSQLRLAITIHSSFIYSAFIHNNLNA